VGKVLDAGLDQRWRRVQLYPTRYQRIRQQLEYYKIHDMTENGEILTTLEKKRMERQMVKAKYGVSFEFVNNNSIQRMIDRNKDAISNGMPVVTWKQAALSLLLPYESITNEKKSYEQKKAAEDRAKVVSAGLPELREGIYKNMPISKIVRDAKKNMKSMDTSINDAININVEINKRREASYKSLFKNILTSLMATKPGAVFCSSLDSAKFG